MICESELQWLVPPELVTYIVTNYAHVSPMTMADAMLRTRKEIAERIRPEYRTHPAVKMASAMHLVCMLEWDGKDDSDLGESFWLALGPYMRDDL